MIERQVRMREVFLMLWAWEYRQFERSGRTGETSWYSLLAHQVDAMLPPRSRWEEANLTSHFMHYSSLPRREFASLLKERWFTLFQEKIELSTNPFSLEQHLRNAGHSSFEDWLEYIRENPVSEEKYERMQRECRQLLARADEQFKKQKKSRAKKPT